MKAHLKRIRVLASRGRFLLLALVLTATYVSINISTPRSAHAAVGSITEYAAPTSGVNPEYLTLGPDNNIWYTGNGKVGKVTTAGSVTQYTTSNSSHWGITTGPDGNLWYSEWNSSSATGYIVRKTTSGSTVGQFSTSSQTVSDMTLGSDGNVWFIESGSGAPAIGSASASGINGYYSISPSYTCSTTVPELGGLTIGPDGNIWFTVYCTGSTHNAIGKITSSGTITIYPILGVSLQPTGITTGPDGNLWFTEINANKIGKMTPTGVVTQYSITTANSFPASITTGSDGALWFTERESGKIGKITTSGTVTEYSVSDAPANNHCLHQITTGPDGAVWFANSCGNKIGRVATQLTNQTISFTSTAPTNEPVSGPTYTPIASATSGLAVAITVDSTSASVCSIDGSGKVSFQAAGTCTIDANQAGNADYNPAAQVQQSFTVSPIDADSSVALSCPSIVHVGDAVSCTITIANSGPAASSDATLTALVPGSLSSLSITGAGATLSGRTITWAASAFASGDSQTITLSGTASTASKAQFSASLLQTSPDPDNSNNIARSVLTIL